MQIRNNVIANQDEMIKALVELLSIPSVIDETDESKPFGKNVDLALKKALEICERFGFSTYYDPKGYYGYADYGKGEEIIGILAHVDVVSEGDQGNWKHFPYLGEVAGGKLYGRGAIDDKGPLIASIYAVKALIDANIDFTKRVRIIIGTDEENSWRGICKYVAKEELPSMGFTPDSSFPVVYAEKGLLQFRLKSDKKSDLRVRGGTAMNAVPETTFYLGDHLFRLEKQLKKLGFDHEIEDEELYVIGRSAHAAKPSAGINAIVRMACALKEIGIDSPTVNFLTEKVGFTHNGELIFGSCSDEPSGELTMSVNQIDLSHYGEVIGIDMRIPVTVDKKFIVDGITRVAEKYGLKYEEVDYLAPLYVERNSVLIKTLVEVYEEETGLSGEPISTGGATYARAMPNIVAFGPIFPGQEKVAHQTDEYIDINAFIKCAQIYAKAIEKLL
ncbi:Sapep family Mn(2+)-dependent dipeptidase [Fusibacter bizertensis]